MRRASGAGGDRRRSAAAAVAVGVVVAAVGVFGTVAGGQELSQPVSALAGADGVRVSVTARGYAAVEELVDVGGPTAQASMDDVEGAALAAYPWPGSTTFFALNAVAARTQQPLAQHVPIARSSTSGQPESRVEAGVVVLTATSDPSASAGTASGGFASDALRASNISSTAAVRHDPATGAASAEATTVSEGVAIGDAVTFGAVRSVARVTSQPGREPTRESELEVSDVVIGGHEVVLRPDGLTLADSGLPLPAENPLADALADAGITIEHVDTVETEDGVVAAGLRITVVREVPELPEPLEVVYELGRARAFAKGGARSTGVEVDGLERIEPAAGVNHGDGGAAARPDPVEGDFAATVGDGHAPASRGNALTVDPAMFYPVLIAAGVVLVCGGTSTRLFGVRLLWNR